MSIREQAVAAASTKRDVEQAAARRRADAELEARLDHAAEVLAPLVTRDDLVVVNRAVKTNILDRNRDRGFGGRSYSQKPYVYTHIKADDLDVAVYRTDGHGGGTRDLQLAVLAACSVCGADCLPQDDGSGYVGLGYIMKTYSTDDEYRRTHLTEEIGKTLTHRYLCATHLANKFDARCDTCGRPFGDQT
jgi:hypothetical protein